MRISLFPSFALSLACLLLMQPIGVKAQARSYQEMRAEVVTLFGEDRFAEAAAILEEALPLYPDHLLANATNLAIMHISLGDPAQSLSALSFGLDHGVWFSKYAFLADLWGPVRESTGWAAFEERNEAARAAEQKNVRPRLEVSLPEGYDPSRQYPLFIALHGGGENLEDFLPQWKSALLRQEFIVAFPQSTQLIAMNGFNWTEDISLSLREIREAYDQLLIDYPVDHGEVLIGGFSSGGVASLEVALRDVVPIRGFVVLCPAMPDAFAAADVRAARDRGVRGTILTTEMDGRVDQQQRMDEIMTQEGLPHEFFITPNIGHWYPDDLAERIDRAILHIRGGS